MPHSTFQYGFEWKAVSVTAELLSRLCGSETVLIFQQKWLLLLNEDGDFQLLTQAPTAETWPDTKKQLQAQGQAFIFIDPFDAPEYTWLEWFKIERQTMEQLLGTTFTEQDFISNRGGAHQPYPETWHVMF